MSQAETDRGGDSTRENANSFCQPQPNPPGWIGRARAAMGGLGGHRAGRYVGHCIEFYSSVPSTMAVARRILDRRGDEAAGAVVIADHQTAGRGRLDRGWEDARGRGLLGSYILSGDLLPEHPSLAVMAAGLAMVRAIRQCCPQLGDRVRLKWPNDVIAVEADGPVKLAGILAESTFEKHELSSVILGIGVNVNQDEHELPSIRPGGLRPSSLMLLGRGGERASATHSPIGREHLLVALCRALDDLCAPGSRPAADVVHADWQRALLGLGAGVSAHSASGTVRGRAVGTSAQGGLQVRTASGETLEIHSGDVVFEWATVPDDG